MIKELLRFEFDEAEPVARRYFLAASGLALAPDTPKYRRMRTSAESVLERVRERLNLAASVCEIENPRIEADILYVDIESFKCAAFGRFRPQDVLTAWAYVATAGDVYIEGDNIAEAVLADIWGTAFTDAVCDIMRLRLAPRASLTPSFGPGFYGMGLDTLSAFVRLCDAASIGVRLSRGGMLLPQKSCAGFVLDAETQPLLSADCESCIGPAGGCRVCKNNPLANG